MLVKFAYLWVRGDGVEPRVDELQGGDCADGHEFVQLDNQQARQEGQGQDTY